jgi:hypothetical protein
VRWECTGSYVIIEGRIELRSERGPCGVARLFDSTFELSDGELRYTDYNGSPLELVIHTMKPWHRVS